MMTSRDSVPRLLKGFIHFIRVVYGLAYTSFSAMLKQ
jgi:hypothetical protein